MSMQAAATLALAEYARPWKLLTLALGVALLIAGSYYYEAPDWDIPISLIMALLAYLTAPWSLRVIVERRWELWPVYGMCGVVWLYRGSLRELFWELGARLRGRK